MANGELDFLDARRRELLSAAAKLDALTLLDRQAAMVERTTRYYASFYQQRFLAESAELQIQALERARAAIKVGAVTLSMTIVGLWAIPLVFAGAGVMTIGQKILMLACFGTINLFINTSMQAVIADDSMLRVAVSELPRIWLDSERDDRLRARAAQWGLMLEVERQLKRIEAPLQLVLAMDPAKLAAFRHAMESEVDKALQVRADKSRVIANTTSDPAERAFRTVMRSPEAMDRARRVMLIEFWAEQANSATALRIKYSAELNSARAEFSRHEHDVRLAISSVAERIGETGKTAY